jgi:hypothetical protein
MLQSYLQKNSSNNTNEIMPLIVRAVILAFFFATAISDQPSKPNGESNDDCPFETACICEDYDGGHDLW